MSNTIQEIELSERMRALTEDKFVIVMQVRHCFSCLSLFTHHMVVFAQPFVNKHKTSVEALKNMGHAVETELQSLLTYYGESTDSPEGAKPEDLFSLILSFSSSLQVSCSSGRTPALSQLNSI
jgi:diaphanous 1